MLDWRGGDCMLGMILDTRLNLCNFSQIQLRAIFQAGIRLVLDQGLEPL